MPKSQLGAFVGRDTELRALRGELEAALAGETRVAFLVGEAGIGKTRTCAALLEEARRRGARVGWGRGHAAAGAPIYRPWVQLLGEIESDLPDRVREPLEAARLALGSASSRPEGASPERARFALFDAVAAALTAAASERPMALVLDDLHWADPGSLQLLGFIGRELRSAPLLILGALRDGEGPADDESTGALSSLMVLGRSVPLRGLGEAAVGTLLVDRMEDPPAAALVQQVLTTTGGNPYLVIEVANLLAASGGDAPSDAVPPGARELLRQRLSVLASDERRALAAASVVGVEFDLPLLARVLALPEARVRGWLESARSRGIVREVEGSLGRFTYVHALLRESLYAELSGEDRVRLHAAVARALEALGEDAQDRLPLLAHHYFEAAKDGETRQEAIRYGMEAGEQALEMLAFEEAAHHFERALSAQAYHDDADRWRLLAGLAQALHGGGEHQRARSVFERSVAAARSVGPPELASAVLRFASAEAETMVPDIEVNGLLEEALGAMPSEAAPLRALLLARLAWGLQLVPGSEARRRRLSDEAAELARSLGDPRTLDIVLGTRLLGLSGPDDVEDRQAAVDEILASASTPSAELNALAIRVADAAERGDRTALDEALGIHQQKAHASRQPFSVWGAANFQTAVALLEGRYAEAETLAKRALKLGSRVLVHSPALQFAQQVFLLWGWQGRLEELEPLLSSGRASTRVVPGWRSALTYFYCFAGRRAEARTELEVLAAEDFRDLPRDGAWLMSTNLLARSCAFLDDAKRAAVLYDLLLPYRGRMVVTRPFVAFGPPVDLSLAGLATVLSRFDAAEEHFAAADATARRMRALPWQAELGYARAGLLWRRDSQQNREPALALLDEADARADALGMKMLVAWIAARRAEIEASSASPDSVGRALVPGPRKAPRGTFQRDGDVWTLAFESSVSRFRDMRGLGYLARLLAEPDREFHVIDLAGPSGRNGEPSVEGDAGEVLDAKARKAYEARLRDAAEEIEEAERMNDRGRLERLRSEVEILSAELSRGFGLGGKARRAGAAQERARIAVTRAVKYAIDKIETQQPELADHLRRSVRTGAYVSYAPSDRDPVRWEL